MFDAISDFTQFLIYITIDRMVASSASSSGWRSALSPAVSLTTEMVFIMLWKIKVTLNLIQFQFDAFLIGKKHNIYSTLPQSLYRTSRVAHVI